MKQCNVTLWADVHTNALISCDNPCRALVMQMREKYTTCDKYCAQQQGGLTCARAWYWDWQTYWVWQTGSCTHEAATEVLCSSAFDQEGGRKEFGNDGICECGPSNVINAPGSDSTSNMIVPQPESHPSLMIGLVTAAGIFLLCILAVAAVFLRRRHRAREAQQPNSVPTTLGHQVAAHEGIVLAVNGEITSEDRKSLRQ
eukprot:TRINITY_DN95901_c0_g1_i1.p1 TRINITY_DN95901_c0_g1~~TRINITY_DN95901_c0_g1_i1.p1  ORF type:complete len:200 (+),score=30.27 TRINITY_DN95901_c0_g1_i1:90-689(+)